MFEIMATVEYQDGTQSIAGFHTWEEVGEFRDSYTDIVGIIAVWKGAKDDNGD